MNTPSIRTRLIEIQLPLAMPQGAEVAFPDQPDLRGVIVTGVEVFTADDIATAPSGTVVVPSADALNLVMTLVEGSDEKVRQVPYFSCRRVVNAGNVRDFRDLSPTWDQCSIRATLALAVGTVTSALVMVHFRYNRDPK